MMSKDKWQKIESVEGINLDLYKSIIESSPAAYAYHKIILDENDCPCDYEFIEVNASFENFSGLKRSDILGKNISEVLPDVMKSEVNWIEYYGNIAINGVSEEFEHFSKTFNRWYKANVYSPKKYFFITQFIDITMEKVQFYDMKRLIELSEDFLQINEQTINYQKITDDFLSICGAKYCAFNLFDEEGKNFTTMAISGNKGILKKANDMIGFKIEGKKWEYDFERDKIIKSDIITRFSSLKELTGQVIPAPIISLIEKTFNIGEVILIKIQKNNIMIGDFSIMMPKGKTFNKDNVAEIFVKQLGMVITRNRVEKSLDKERNRLTNVLEGTNVGTWEWNVQTDETLIDERWAGIIGYTLAEISLFNTEIVYPEDIKISEVQLKQVLDKELDYYDIEFRMKHKDGSLIWAQDRGKVTSWTADGKPLIMSGTHTDITARKQIEAEIVKAKEEAEAANAAKSQFLSNMSHEIRTPMNGFMGMIQLMQTTELTEDQQDFMRIANSSAEGLLAVINDILDYSKIEAGKMPIEKKTFNIRKLINDTIELFKVSAKSAGLLIEASIEKDIPDNIIGDSFRLKQIISNLIGNAVKFTQNGSINIVVKDIKGQRNNEIKLEFAVKDTGIGISLDKVDVLFKRFSQVDSSNTRLYGGSGLGLSICKGLVEKMGGEIWVESIEGEGSSFYFTSMFEKTVEQIDYIEPAAVMHVKEQRDISILLVEDDAVSRTVMEKFAERKGWKVTIAENGKQAFDIFNQNSFDIVLMDVQMPVLNGYETTRIFRGLESSKGIHTPIIAITAFALKGDREKCLEAGMDDYLSKPVDVNEFYEMVEKWTIYQSNKEFSSIR